MPKHPHHSLHAKAKKDFFDYAVYFFMIATPMFELPQAYTIYANKNAQNVSIFTWGFFALADIVWLIYAIRNKIVPLAILYALFLTVESSIIVGILLYS